MIVGADRGGDLRVAAPLQGPGLSDQHQECSLGGVLGRMHIPQHPQADPEHHGAVARDKGGERRLVSLADKGS